MQILHKGKSPLNKFDKDLAGLLVKSYKEYGINISVNTKVTKVEKLRNEFVVYCNVRGMEKTFKCDLAVHAAGRAPDIDELNLAAAGVKRDKKGIIVNEYLQSISNPDVYSAGDSASGKNGLPLTPVASKGAEIVTQNLIRGNTAKADFKVTPSVVFSLPPLVSVGLTEVQAQEKNIKYKVNFGDSSDWFSSKRIGMKHTGYKILTDMKTDKILGAHLLSDNADEVINIFSLAMSAGLGIKDIKKTIFTYPTQTSDITYMLNLNDYKTHKK